MNDWLKTDAGWFGVDHFPTHDLKPMADDVESPSRVDIAVDEDAKEDAASAAVS